jgi:hypothetical protein
MFATVNDITTRCDALHAANHEFCNALLHGLKVVDVTHCMIATDAINAKLTSLRTDTWVTTSNKQHAALKQRQLDAVATSGAGAGANAGGPALVFEQNFALEDAIGSHACFLEALACVQPITNQ